MKTLILDKEFSYDGSQLRPLFNYLEHGLLGDSILVGIGPCKVDLGHMIDGEDLREGATIAGGKMLHCLIEVFDRDLFSGVCLQRLLAALAQARILSTPSAKLGSKPLTRSGDDLYWDGRKLSISIATRSANSVLVHFAMNVSNTGTPVPTCALEQDFSIPALEFGRQLAADFVAEYESILMASRKARPV